MSAYISRAAVLAVVLAVVGAASAAVPPVTYLVPDAFRAGSGEQVKLHVESGTPLSAQIQRWPHEKLRWFFVLGDGTRHNRDTIKPIDAEGREVAVTLAQPGATVVGFDAKPVVTPFAAADLHAFLSANVADSVHRVDPRRGAREQELRVRRIESATTMVRVPAADGRELPSGTAMTKTGQAVEIRPLFDPTMLRVGSDFPVRVYVGGSKRPNAKVLATSVTGGQTVAATADATGSTHFRIDHPGVWRVEFHHAEPLENDADADWVVYSATLTFKVAAEGAEK